MYKQRRLGLKTIGPAFFLDGLVSKAHQEGEHTFTLKEGGKINLGHVENHARKNNLKCNYNGDGSITLAVKE